MHIAYIDTYLMILIKHTDYNCLQNERCKRGHLLLYTYVQNWSIIKDKLRLHLLRLLNAMCVCVYSEFMTPIKLKADSCSRMRDAQTCFKIRNKI